MAFDVVHLILFSENSNLPFPDRKPSKKDFPCHACREEEEEERSTKSPLKAGGAHHLLALTRHLWAGGCPVGKHNTASHIRRKGL